MDQSCTAPAIYPMTTAIQSVDYELKDSRMHSNAMYVFCFIVFVYFDLRVVDQHLQE